jgi:futalosine hydrolase
MIALICSVQAEAERLLGSLTVMRSTTLGSKLLIEGLLDDHRVALCISGMGKVNAAHAATLILTKFEPDAILVFGIGGAYPSSGAQIGDIALAKEEIAGDEGVLTQDGFKDTEYIGIPLLKTATSLIYTTYPAAEHLVQQSLKTLGPYQETGGKLHVGSFVTLSTCTGTSARSQELENRYHGLCENMEGAAVAQVAELHNIPWGEVRGISNLVEDRDLSKWRIPLATHAVQQAVRTIVRGWEG